MPVAALFRRLVSWSVVRLLDGCLFGCSEGWKSVWSGGRFVDSFNDSLVLCCSRPLGWAFLLCSLCSACSCPFGSFCSVCAMPAAVCLVTLLSCAVSAMPAAVRLGAFRFCPVCTVPAAVRLTVPSVPCSPSSAWSFCSSTLLFALCYARSCPHAFCVCSRPLDRSVSANPAVVRFVVLLFRSACTMPTAVCLASPSFF